MRVFCERCNVEGSGYYMTDMIGSCKNLTHVGARNAAVDTMKLPHLD